MILNAKKIIENPELATCSISQKPSYSVKAVLETIKTTTIFSFHKDYHNQHLKVFLIFFLWFEFYRNV